ERFPVADQAAIADIDLDMLAQERLQMGSFDTNRRRHGRPFRRAGFTLAPPRDTDVGFRRRIERFPFVPADVARLEQDCYEAYNIQVSGLAQRMRATGSKKAIIGISGGLDSTQALLVCAQAFDLLGLPRENILAYTMPGFATSDHTKSNAWRLMRALGVSAHELDIRPAARRAILATEISPELIPAEEGATPQSSEAKIGPYALQDFTLFHILRYGFPPSKIAFMALHTWEDSDRGDWPPHFEANRRVAY